jgi:Domain of unknown function (DUF3883)
MRQGGAIMVQYWCVNFEDDAAFDHGMSEKLWSMGYQFGENDSANRLGRIRMNWERAAKVQPGDKFVAYRKTNTFFAVGTTVRSARRTKTAEDTTETIGKYLDGRESYEDGYIYFDGTVIYENFTDDMSDYPARMDVESWDYYVPDGVVLPIINKIKVNERHMAVMKIDENDYNQIVAALAAKGGTPPKEEKASVVEVENAVAETAEVTHARRQGFRLDKKLRDALEQHAMDAAKQFFKTKGYHVDDHHKDHPYDLLCTKKGERLFVEVKGTEMGGKTVILTAGEVEFARRNKNQMALFVLHSIKVSPDGKVSGGKIDVRWPWHVDDGVLRPISYWYDLP